MHSFRFLLSILLLGALATGAAAEKNTLQLEVGDAERRASDAAVILDAIVDTRTGDVLDPDELAARLAGKRLVFVGESHTDMEFHRVQLEVIQALHRAGRRVMIGLEMYPVTEQEHLDHWSAGHFTEEGFIEISGWYKSWSQNWLFYRDIFVFARDNGLPMKALNAPRDVVKAVRQKGFDGLDEDEKQYMPPSIDLTEEHRVLFKSYFDDDDPLHASMTDEQWDGMIRAQATWDGAMGYNALKGIYDSVQAGKDVVMVVLIGSGHVAYGLGIEHQAGIYSALHDFDAPMASVIPVPVLDEDREPLATVSASYADFIWGVPASTDPLYPVLGLSSTPVDKENAETSRRKVIYVSEDSPAEAAGFEVGDIVLTMDGVDVAGKGVIGRLMGGKSWGDRARWTVQRGEEEVALKVQLRRELPSDDDEDGDGEDDDGEGDGAGDNRS